MLRFLGLGLGGGDQYVGAFENYDFGALVTALGPRPEYVTKDENRFYLK